MVNNCYRKFDMIVMDTTYHWRAHSTNLLSVEFLNLARKFLMGGRAHSRNGWRTSLS